MRQGGKARGSRSQSNANRDGNGVAGQARAVRTEQADSGTAADWTTARDQTQARTVRTEHTERVEQPAERTVRAEQPHSYADAGAVGTDRAAAKPARSRGLRFGLLGLLGLLALAGIIIGLVVANRTTPTRRAAASGRRPAAAAQAQPRPSSRRGGALPAAGAAGAAGAAAGGRTGDHMIASLNSICRGQSRPFNVRSGSRMTVRYQSTCPRVTTSPFSLALTNSSGSPAQAIANTKSRSRFVATKTVRANAPSGSTYRLNANGGCPYQVRVFGTR